MRTIRLSDGGELAFREAGQGTPLMLVHGWGLAGEAFETQLRTLARAHRVIVPDLRGHGQSSAYHAGRFATLADDLCELIDTLGLHDVVVVGWSLGALVAWDLALRHGDGRLAGVLSVDMVPRLLNGPTWPHGLREGTNREAFTRAMDHMTGDWKAFTHVFVARIFARGASPEPSLIAWLERMAEANDGATLASLWGDMVEQDLAAKLAGITVPWLHVYGVLSRLYAPAAARWLAEETPAIDALAFEASGHAPHLEEPGRFDRIVTEFARSVAPGAAEETDLAGARRNRIH